MRLSFEWTRRMTLTCSYCAQTWLDVMQDESPLLSRNTSHDRDSQSETVRHYNGGSRSDSSGPEEWRSRVARNRTGSSFARAAPNPNDEEAVPTIVLKGRGPGRRAGHTATAVNRRIYVFGGSCGSDYLVRAQNEEVC
jgi:hypothetical protein